MKKFLTYQQQVDKLVNEKGLIVDDIAYAKDVLKQLSYYPMRFVKNTVNPKRNI